MPHRSTSRRPARRRSLLAVPALLALFAVGCSQSGGDGADGPVTTTTATTASTSTTTTSPTSTTTRSTTTTSSPPSTAAPTTATTIAEGPVDIDSFVSPSGNIGCMVIVDSTAAEARCDIRSATFTPPPRPADCDLEWGPALAVADGPGHFACVGDTVYDTEAQVLPYGSSMSNGPFTCISERVGVTCTNRTTGHGFALRRAAYRLF